MVIQFSRQKIMNNNLLKPVKKVGNRQNQSKTLVKLPAKIAKSLIKSLTRTKLMLPYT